MKELIDIYKKSIKKGQGLYPETDAMKQVTAFLNNYNGSWLDLALSADRLSAIASKIFDGAKEKAVIEAELNGHNSKFTHMGIDVTPRITVEYEYPENDTYVKRYEADLENLAKQIAPLKTKETTLKKSIKNRIKQLADDGEISVAQTKRTLSISRS
jgi:hypothetical protein